MTTLKKHYKFKLESEFTHVHPLFNGVEFENSLVTINGGVMKISPGYAWDGCSPKFNIAGLLTVGTPDGSLRHGYAWTYYSSLVHDVLCQFRYELPFTKDQVIAVFEDQLKGCSWPLTRIYVGAVSLFGPKDFGKADKT